MLASIAGYLWTDDNHSNFTFVGSGRTQTPGPQLIFLQSPRRRLPWANPYPFYIDPDKNPLYDPLHCVTKFAADILSVISNVGMYLEYDFGKFLEPGE